MQTPTPTSITVDPELAILNLLAVATDMTVALLAVLHPPAGANTVGDCDRALHLNHRIARDARRFRDSLTDYLRQLDLQYGPSTIGDNPF